MQIVAALQRQGEIVAMTGDGVNDAPVPEEGGHRRAMGIKGTEVAKETADMIITRQLRHHRRRRRAGRIVYANIIRFVHYLFSCNFSEILTVFAAIMIGCRCRSRPANPVAELVTDVFRRSRSPWSHAPDVMTQPARDPKQPLVNRAFVGLIAWQGALLPE